MIFNDCGFVTLTTESHRACLDFVHGAKSFGQLRRELIIKLPPVLIPDLCLEAVKDLNIEKYWIKLSSKSLYSHSSACRVDRFSGCSTKRLRRRRKWNREPRRLGWRWSSGTFHERPSPSPRCLGCCATTSTWMSAENSLEISTPQNLFSFLNFNPIKSAQNHQNHVEKLCAKLMEIMIYHCFRIDSRVASLLFFC